MPETLIRRRWNVAGQERVERRANAVQIGAWIIRGKGHARTSGDAGIRKVDLPRRCDPDIRRTHIAMDQAGRVLMKPVERVEHGLDQSNCGIGAESPLCVARADVFQGQTGNMVKDEKTPFDRRKHIDHCRERRVAHSGKCSSFTGEKCISIRFDTGDCLDIDILFRAPVARQVEITERTAIKEALDQIAILESCPGCCHMNLIRCRNGGNLTSTADVAQDQSILSGVTCTSLYVSIRCASMLRRVRAHPLLHDADRAGATCAPQTQAPSAASNRRRRRPGVWRGAVRTVPTVKTGLLSCCLRGRRHLGMCKNSDAALRLDSFAFVTSLQKRTAETPGSQSFPLQHFSDTLTTVHICRVARDACVQRSVDRNLFRSSRGARHSQEYSTLFIRFNLCENCYNRALRLLRLCGDMTFLQEARLLHRSVRLRGKFA
jgi:hypothetical protein